MAETAGMMKSAGTVGPPNIPRLPGVRRDLSHVSWDAPAAPGLVLGGVPGEMGTPCMQGALPAPSAPAPGPLALGAALGSGTAPGPPALDPAVGSPGRAVPAAFPEQMAAAWGGWRRLSASSLSCTHSVIPGGSGSGGRCRWGQRWPNILHGFSELSPRGQATQED